MALDPLTALSVAGTVIQFLDFSTKVISRTSKLYKSIGGTLDWQEELQLVISDLVQIVNRIPRSLSLSNDQSATEDEEALQKLCKVCVDIADELLARLNKLKVPSGHKHKMWKSFHEALKSVWKEEDMKSMMKRLSAVREEIQMRVILGLRVQLDNLSLQKSKRFDILDNATRSILTAILNTTPNIMDSIAELKDVMQSQTLAIAQILGRVDCNAIKQNFITGTAVEGESSNGRTQMQLGQIKSGRRNEFNGIVIDGLIEAQIRKKVSEEVVIDLYYSTITTREEQIAEAHKETFRWIFNNASESNQPWDSFTDWLKSGSGIYWVNGKAASGKSTLMRYLHDHPVTSQLLVEWANPLPLTTGHFFFWNSGMPIQRSHAGLLRSLLFECLNQNPALVPIVFPLDWARKYLELVMPFEDTPYVVDWEEIKTLNEIVQSHLRKASKAANPATWLERRQPGLTASQRGSFNDGEAQNTTADRWPLAYLKEAFDNLVKQDAVPIKICIFVDGLDEYDGDHSTIASLFEKISTSPHVKVCVSSRPLLPFSDAFRETRSLRLQDLTKKDIERYVTSSLSNNFYFQQFAQEEPTRVYFLIDDIVSKANGVFLWVTLVIKSLLEGLRNRDDISDLQRRIDVLPPDLETLFDSMISKIPEFYLVRTSKLFQIVRSSREHTEVAIDLITLSLADDPDYGQAITAPFNDISEEEMMKRCERMEDRLKVISMGLLEAVKQGCERSHRASQMCGRVQYLHRTVRDYLEGPKIWPMMLQRTQGTDFNPNTSMVRAFVWRLKLNIELEGTELIATAAFIHAYHADVETQQSNSALLSQLDRARERYWSLYLSREIEHRNFTRLAVQHDLCSYINETQDYDSVRKRYDGFPLLYWALNLAHRNELVKLSSRMVTILLQLGADPNEILAGEDTVWGQLLVRIWDCSSISMLSTYIKIVKVMLEYGADPNAKAFVKREAHRDVQSSRWRGMQSARWDVQNARLIVQNAFGSTFSDEAALLDSIFIARGAKVKKPSFYQRVISY